MRAIGLFLCGLVALGSRLVGAGTVCREHTHCKACVQASSWLAGCNWCPVDNQCHAELVGSWNPCAGDQNVHDVASCPADPVPQTGFSLAAAHEMLIYANAAYLDDPAAGNPPLPPTFQLNQTFTYPLPPTITITGNAAGFIGTDLERKQIVLAFRGTHGNTTVGKYKQLISEGLNTDMVGYPGHPGVTVNHYFVAAAASLRKTVYGALAEMQLLCPDCTLWVTGHSLGAAMAAVSAFDLASSGRTNPPMVYTFGQPRFGNYAFSRAYAKAVPTTYRMVNAADPIVHFPGCDHDDSRTGIPAYYCTSKDSPSAYHHAGLELWFPNGEYQQDAPCGFRACVGEPLNEDFACSNGLMAEYNTDMALATEDHQGYWKGLKRGFCGSGWASATGTTLLV